MYIHSNSCDYESFCLQRKQINEKWTNPSCEAVPMMCRWHSGWFDHIWELSPNFNWTYRCKLVSGTIVLQVCSFRTRLFSGALYWTNTDMILCVERWKLIWNLISLKNTNVSNSCTQNTLLISIALHFMTYYSRHFEYIVWMLYGLLQRTFLSNPTSNPCKHSATMINTKPKNQAQYNECVN